ncbi:MAG: RHS repeat-associated core domain-containing protein, partial [Abditibacteriaceae bacterium]
VTDASQATVAQYEYDAYGNTINSSGAYASQNPWRFSTKYYDDGSGMYYYGYRFYSPGLGKWINRDPIAEGGGLNLYGAFGNSPGNFNDAYGHALGDWIDHRIFNDSVANFGTAYGNYDSGCGSGWGVAQLGLIAGGKTVALGFSAGYFAAAGGTAMVGAAGISGATAASLVAEQNPEVAAATQGVSSQTTVIGSRLDTMWYWGRSGYNVLDIPNWTLRRNIRWLDVAIQRGDTIKLVTDPEYWRTITDKSAFFSELEYLERMGFIRLGDEMVRK